MTENPYATSNVESPGVEPSSSIPPSPDDRLWATLAHLAYFVVPIFGTLVIYLVKKDESEFVKDQSQEALNFQITTYIVIFACSATIFLIPVAAIVAVAAIVYAIIAAFESNKGVLYRYPYTLRLIN